jgi:acetylornithine deacetylase/succinyl-diaminopimelate desuccinylase family protein
MDLRAKLKKHVEKIPLAKILKRLISFDTSNPPSEDLECVNYISDILEEYGLSPKIKNVSNDGKMHNLVVTIGKLDQGIIFNGHHDVVPPGDGWNTPPFKPQLKGTHLYGRGSADMKGGLSAMIGAIASLAQLNINYTNKITFCSVADEEGNSLGTNNFLADKITAKYAIVGESTDYNIITSRKGLTWLKIITRGKSCHARKPWAGSNAIEHMAEIITRLKHNKFKFRTKEHPRLRKPTISIGTIKGGNKINIVPDSCEIMVDVRTIPTQSYIDVISDIKAALADIEGKINYKIVVDYTMPSHEVSGNSKIVQTLLHNTKEIIGRNTFTKAREGTSDVVLFGKKNIQAVDFGPIGNNCHSPNEYVDLPSVQACAKIYALTALDLINY